MLSVRLSSRGWLIYPGLRTTTVCCLPIPARLNRLPSGTHRRNSLGNNPWGKRKAKKRRRRQRMATTKSMKFFLIGWGRLRLRMSAATGFGPGWLRLCGCCRCVIQQNNQQRARVFKPSQIYFLMLFFCNFPHFTLVFHASSALWSSSSTPSQWQYLTMLCLLLLSPRPENGRLNWGPGIAIGIGTLFCGWLCASVFVCVWLWLGPFSGYCVVPPLSLFVALSIFWACVGRLRAECIYKYAAAFVARELLPCLLCPSNYALSSLDAWLGVGAGGLRARGGTLGRSGDCIKINLTESICLIANWRAKPAQRERNNNN